MQTNHTKIINQLFMILVLIPMKKLISKKTITCKERNEDVQKTSIKTQ